jgi:adenine-specific DNA-methyltransferase
MPSLHWIGKEKVINHHLDVPYRVLDHQYTFNGSQTAEVFEVKGETGNKIIHGDNLEALKSLLPEYEGKIKCIYIDPPYNTGNEGWVYNDNVNDPKLKKWLGQVVGKETEDMTRHDKWLCMMYPRLKLLHKLLAEDGVIFISLDEVETTHLRCIMNEIFGENNFIAQITLLCNPKGRSQDKYFSTNHEYITVFSKDKLPKDSFSITKEEDLIEKEYKLKDQKGRYRLMELRNTHREFSKDNRPNLFYPFYINPENGEVSLIKNEDFQIECKPLWPDGFEGCWTWGKELSAKDSHLLIAQNIRGNWKIFRKSYSAGIEGENVKRKLFTIWSDSKFYTEKGQIVFGEIFSGLNKNDFPQPKSVDLVTEVLRTNTRDGDIILDSFAGSGTTAHAVLNLNKLDGGKRKFICIEMENYAETITAERVKRVSKGYGDKEGTGGSFDYYELGPALFNDDNEINELVGVEKLRQYIYYTETKGVLNSPFEGGVRRTGDANDNEFLLKKHNDTAYYFYYEQDGITTLNHEFLSTIKTKAEQYVIYADNCLLTKEFMTKHKIIFKKIPRDITKF